MTYDKLSTDLEQLHDALAELFTDMQELNKDLETELEKL